MPVIDGVSATVNQAEALISLGLKTAKRGAYADLIDENFRGAMATFLPAFIRA